MLQRGKGIRGKRRADSRALEEKPMGVENFAGRLKELREAAGLTQERLAHQAGLTKDGVAQLEQGRREPTWATVLALAGALGVSCEAFTAKPATVSEPKRGRPLKPKDPEQKRSRGRRER